MIVSFITGILTAGSISSLAATGRSGKPEELPAIRVAEDGRTMAIVIQGREVMRVDADGVHVTGDLTYSGSLTDVGAKGPKGGAPR
ncbi:hypothetical protein [Afifella pfennigii]|uniref:hypothetical protein n=1 Tax=Afifella pfennigii TaxID=209897 RepID=UPI00047ABA84|nr:hypothetical protein [Afifella pfennigii]